jgi:hypothetical protein
MYGGAVSWSSKKTHSSGVNNETEYQACGSAVRAGLSMLKILNEIALLLSDFPHDIEPAVV